jgi:uncharacterized spore protein YtfJ
MENSNVSSVLSKLDIVRDTLTVKRVFGEAYEVDGVTVIPVAMVYGGGGGGGGEGSGPDETGTGSGGGLGFGVMARPVGVYVSKDGDVTWRPAVDVMAIVLGAQALALVGVLTIRRVLSRRRRHHHR